MERNQLLLDEVKVNEEENFAYIIDDNEKIINVLVIIELAKQMGIPTSTYNLVSIKDGHQLTMASFLSDEERLLAFNQVIETGQNNRSTYLISLGFTEERVNEIEMLFNKIVLFGYLSGSTDYESSYGLITDGTNFRTAPLVSKENVFSKQILPFSPSLINNMGLQCFGKILEEMAATLDIKAAYQKLEERGIIIPDDLYFKQIENINYNYDKLNNELLDRRENEMCGYYDETFHSTK